MSRDGDHDEHRGGRQGPPEVSRLGRASTRPFRTLYRSGDRYATRDRRKRGQRGIDELVGVLVKNHGLTDEVRQRVVCLYWAEIAGDRIASKTFPVALFEGVLQLSAKSSAWVQEMQYFKLGLIAKINSWVEAQRVWLGPGALVTDLRVMLGTQRREVLVDPEHADQLRLRDAQRARPPEATPPSVSTADRESIIAETTVVEDDDLRATIERVRTLWNR